MGGLGGAYVIGCKNVSFLASLGEADQGWTKTNNKNLLETIR